MPQCSVVPACTGRTRLARPPRARRRQAHHLWHADARRTHATRLRPPVPAARGTQPLARCGSDRPVRTTHAAEARGTALAHHQWHRYHRPWQRCAANAAATCDPEVRGENTAGGRAGSFQPSWGVNSRISCPGGGRMTHQQQFDSPHPSTNGARVASSAASNYARPRQ
eukprot:3863966-Prymnesium_polylepis.2